MQSTLIKIKRAMLSGHYVFTGKARIEMQCDGITELDVIESIVNATAIYKTLRSRSPLRKSATEYLYVIQSSNMEGLMIYTKGKFVTEGSTQTFYLLISSKRGF